ncbi:unnamed protein product [Orchesella dallaii]|uniref:Uncharacterized protein n=1 Tax=Orchesella dallaii TaxID=48710 RepID=A0ABP1QJH4_9HEXA
MPSFNKPHYCLLCRCLCPRGNAVQFRNGSTHTRPKEDYSRDTDATETRMHNKIDTNVAVQQAKAVSNKSEIKSESVQMPFTPNNSDNPSLVIREKRWDGCGYKGIC